MSLVIKFYFTSFMLNMFRTLIHPSSGDLTKLDINTKHRLMTLDINDLYVNITITETIDITATQLLKHNEPEITTQIFKLLETILQ